MCSVQISPAVGDTESLSGINLICHLDNSANREILLSVETMVVPSGECKGLWVGQKEGEVRMERPH